MTDLNAKLQTKKNLLRKALFKKGIVARDKTNTYDNYKYFSEAGYKKLFTECRHLHYALSLIRLLPASLISLRFFVSYIISANVITAYETKTLKYSPIIELPIRAVPALGATMKRV